MLCAQQSSSVPDGTPGPDVPGSKVDAGGLDTGLLYGAGQRAPHCIVVEPRRRHAHHVFDSDKLSWANVAGSVPFLTLLRRAKQRELAVLAPVSNPHPPVHVAIYRTPRRR